MDVFGRITDFQFNPEIGSLGKLVIDVSFLDPEKIEALKKFIEKKKFVNLNFKGVRKGTEVTYELQCLWFVVASKILAHYNNGEVTPEAVNALSDDLKQHYLPVKYVEYPKLQGDPDRETLTEEEQAEGQVAKSPKRELQWEIVRVPVLPSVSYLQDSETGLTHLELIEAVKRIQRDYAERGVDFEN